MRGVYDAALRGTIVVERLTKDLRTIREVMQKHEAEGDAAEALARVARMARMAKIGADAVGLGLLIGSMTETRS